MKKYRTFPPSYLSCFALLFCGSYFYSVGYPWKLNIVLSAVVAILVWYKVYGWHGGTAGRQHARIFEPIIYLLALGCPMTLAGVSDWMLEKAMISVIFWCVLLLASREWHRRGATLFDVIYASALSGLLFLAYRWPYMLIVVTGILLGWASYSSKENR